MDFEAQAWSALRADQAGASTDGEHLTAIGLHVKSGGVWLPWDGSPAAHVHAHGVLTGLSNDDHTQYALLAGRGVLQTLKGGLAGGSLALQGSGGSALLGTAIFRTTGTASSPHVEFNDGATGDAFMRLENRVGVGIDPLANTVLRVGIPTIGTGIVSQLALVGTKTLTASGIFNFVNFGAFANLAGAAVNRAIGFNVALGTSDSVGGGTINELNAFRMFHNISAGAVSEIVYFTFPHPSTPGGTIAKLGLFDVGDADDGIDIGATTFGIRFGNRAGKDASRFGEFTLGLGGICHPIWDQAAPGSTHIFSNPMTVGADQGPDAFGLIDMVSTTKAPIFPRMTTAQRNAITAVDGMVVFNQDAAIERLQARESDSWESLSFEKQTEIDFGATPVDNATFVIVDTAITTGSRILAKVAYEAPTGKDLDEVEMDMLELLCAPGSGQFTLFARGMEGYVADKFKVNYVVA